MTKENRAEWTVFTTIRNHFDAAVSWVFRKYKTRGGEPKEWNVEAFDLALGEANRWTTEDRMWGLHGDDADVLVRYETLDEGLAAVCEGAGVTAPTVARHNVSRHRDGRPYQEFYDNDTRAYIERRFGTEMQELSYSFLGG